MYHLSEREMSEQKRSLFSRDLIIPTAIVIRAKEQENSSGRLWQMPSMSVTVVSTQSCCPNTRPLWRRRAIGHLLLRWPASARHRAPRQKPPVGGRLNLMAYATVPFGENKPAEHGLLKRGNGNAEFLKRKNAWRRIIGRAGECFGTLHLLDSFGTSWTLLSGRKLPRPFSLTAIFSSKMLRF